MSTDTASNSHRTSIFLCIPLTLPFLELKLGIIIKLHCVRQCICNSDHISDLQVVGNLRHINRQCIIDRIQLSWADFTFFFKAICIFISCLCICRKFIIIRIFICKICMVNKFCTISDCLRNSINSNLNYLSFFRCNVRIIKSKSESPVIRLWNSWNNAASTYHSTIINGCNTINHYSSIKILVISMRFVIVTKFYVCDRIWCRYTDRYFPGQCSICICFYKFLIQNSLAICLKGTGLIIFCSVKIYIYIILKYSWKCRIQSVIRYIRCICKCICPAVFWEIAQFQGWQINTCRKSCCCQIIS